MKKIALIFCAVFILSGCGSNVEMVKSGVMDFNQTTTIGQALDGWKSCKAKSWEEFITDNGVPVVQFTCQHKIDKYFGRAISLIKDERASDVEYLEITSNKQFFQFTINQDGSFQIDNVQVETAWKDGKVYTDGQSPLEQLNTAYINELNFDPDELNEMGAIQLAYLFGLIKKEAI
jgi:hypothetical protein